MHLDLVVIYYLVFGFLDLLGFLGLLDWRGGCLPLLLIHTFGGSLWTALSLVFFLLCALR